MKTTKIILLFLVICSLSPRIKAQKRLISPKSIENLCPNKLDGHLLSQNLNFDSQVNTQLRITYYVHDSKLFANIRLQMSSPKRNGAKLDAIFRQPIYVIPSNKYIVNDLHNKEDLIETVLPKGGSEFLGICNDGTSFKFNFEKGSWAHSVELIGDTGDNDISEDRDCHCDSKIVKISFKSFYVELKEKEFANITRWRHEKGTDWVDQSDLIATAEQMESWGYTNPTDLFSGKLKGGNGMIPLYRYHHPNEGKNNSDYVTTNDFITTPKQMENWGYTDRTLLCYVFDKDLGENYYEISRWYNDKEKDWITTTERVTTDRQMKSWGYTDKKILGYFYSEPVYVR